MADTVVIYDTFTGTSGANVDGHTPDVCPAGAAWSSATSGARLVFATGGGLTWTTPGSGGTSFLSGLGIPSFDFSQGIFIEVEAVAGADVFAALDIQLQMVASVTGRLFGIDLWPNVDQAMLGISADFPGGSSPDFTVSPPGTVWVAGEDAVFRAEVDPAYTAITIYKNGSVLATGPWFGPDFLSETAPGFQFQYSQSAVFSASVIKTLTIGYPNASPPVVSDFWERFQLCTETP